MNNLSSKENKREIKKKRQIMNDWLSYIEELEKTHGI